MVSRFKKNFKRFRNSWIPRESKRIVDGKRTGPNSTETRFYNDVLFTQAKLCKITYQPKPIVITKTAKREYTADYLSEINGCRAYYEVKGSYRLPTYERARLAWELASEQNPQWMFVWAELTKRGWEIECWERGGEIISVMLPGDSEFKKVSADWRRHKPRKSSTRNRKDK